MTSPTIIKISPPRIIKASIQGPPGPAGTPGSAESVGTRYNYAFGIGNSTVLFSLLTGKTLTRIEVYNTIPFDGTAPELLLGTLSEPSKFISAEFINIKETGVFIFNPLFTPITDTPIYLRITPDVDTANGSGFFLIHTS